MNGRHPQLSYLYRKPYRINWKIVAGPGLNPIQLYDIVYDQEDFKIRKMENVPDTML